MHTQTEEFTQTNTQNQLAWLALQLLESLIESMLGGISMLAEVHEDRSIEGSGLHSHLHVALAPFWVVPCAAFP